jgi:glycosyltransferase involved in cell wall biosynthesis
VKILFVLEHFHPYIGGVETLFFELTTSLARQGHQVAVVTTKYHPSLQNNEIVQGVEIHRITCRNRFLFSFLSIPAITKLAGQYDLIQTTSYNAALPAWIAAKFRSKPIVITFHEVWGPLWQKLPFIPPHLRILYRIWEWFILKLTFDRFIAVSDATRSSLSRNGVPDEKLVRIYNGIDYRQFSSFSWKPPHTFTVTYFGRLGASKGLDLLLGAAGKFCHKHPEAKLKMIIPRYPAAFFQKILHLIKDNGLESHILMFHDLSKAELYHEISGSSCIVIPSHSEGFCFVAAEATALGIPIVSSQKMALEEVTGGQVVTIDPLTVEGLGIALEKAKNQEWIYIPPRTFGLQDAVGQYEDIYKELFPKFKK